MNSENKHTEIMSFGQMFRIVFVLFSLYLLGDAFSRWDGFSHYASFSEFLPSVSLAFILWSLVAFVFAIAAWIILRVFEWLSFRTGMNIKLEHLLFFNGVFILFGALAWKSKKIIWPDIETSLQLKLLIFIGVLFLSLLFSIKTRNKTEQWLSVILDRITPLVWIFSMFVFLSIPLVAYYAILKETGKAVSEQRYVADARVPNIILVTFDALAAREMSLYGYNKKTTPFIDKWAEKATVFSKVEAASNFTASSIASLMTGKRVWTHQVYHIEGSRPVKSDIESLPAVLKDNGYYNIALVVNPFASVRILGMENSFDIAPLASEFGTPASFFGWKFGFIDIMLYRAFGDKIKLHNWIIRNDFILSKILNRVSRNIDSTTVPPEKAFNRLLEIIDNNAPMPYFAWVHLFPPHDPYLPPGPFKGKFSSSSEMRTYKTQEELIEYSYKYLFKYEPIPEKIKPAVNMLRNYYDENILYVDKSFENFIKELEKRKVDNTVLILSSDHGESFDHGYFTHGGPFLYEQVTHVPLIVKEPGQVKGQVGDTLVEQIDIPATILKLAGVSVPGWMEGRSLVPFLRGKDLPGRTAFSMNFELNRSQGNKIEQGSIAMWEGDYKLIHYLDRNESLLFNILRDPYEMSDLNDKEPEVSLRMLDIMKGRIRDANDKISKEK